MSFGPTKKSGKGLLAVVVFIFIILGGYILTRYLIIEDVGRESSGDVVLTPITAGDLLARIENSKAQVKLVNMWATWCAPCIEEFPYILQLGEKYKDQGVELFLVSMDMDQDLEKARSFLASQGVGFESFFKNQSDNDFISEMHDDWSGALPATFIYNDRAELKDFWTGDASFDEFEEATLGVLKPQE